MKTIIYATFIVLITLSSLTRCSKDNTLTSQKTTDPCAGSNSFTSISSPDIKLTSLKGTMTSIGWSVQPGEITIGVDDCADPNGFTQGHIVFGHIYRESLDSGVREFIFTDYRDCKYYNCLKYHIISAKVTTGNTGLYTDEESSKTSILTITKYDPVNRLISGTFNFDALGGNYAKVRSTFNGSFTDVKL